MEEQEVLNRANALGVKALSESNIADGWRVCINLINRIDDFHVFISEYGIHDEDIDEVFALEERLTSIANKAKRELIRRRDAGEFITYR